MTKHPKGDVADIYKSYPPQARRLLLDIRRLILSSAAADSAVGPLTETLKWSEPAYLTEKTKSGSTIRLGWKAKAPNEVAMYLNCQTTLVDSFRSWFPELNYAGNRALVFNIDAPLPEAEIKVCIDAALNYHRNKKANPKAKRAKTRKRL